MVKPAAIPERGPMKRYAEAINRLGEAVQSLRIQPGIGYNVHRTSAGQVLRIASKQTVEQTQSGSDIAIFKVKENRAKYVIGTQVNPLGEEIDGALVSIAKPKALWVERNASVYGLFADATTLTAEAHRTTGNAFNYDYRRLYFGAISTSTKYILQKVLPTYIEEGGLEFRNLIFAIKGTAIPVDDANANIEWTDLNIDARIWQVPLMNSSMCVETYNAQAGVFTTTASDVVIPGQFKT